MNGLVSSGESERPSGVRSSRGARVPSGICMGNFEPPGDVEQDPPLVGVVSDRFEQQIRGTLSEKERTSRSKTQSSFLQRFRVTASPS